MHVIFVIFAGLAVSHRHTYMFSAGDDKMVKCWDLEQNKVRRLRLSIGWRWTPYTFFLHLAIILQFYLFAFCWRCFSKFSMTLCLGSFLYYDELNLVFENQRFRGAGSACLIRASWFWILYIRNVGFSDWHKFEGFIENFWIKALDKRICSD